MARGAEGHVINETAPRIPYSRKQRIVSGSSHGKRCNLSFPILSSLIPEWFTTQTEQVVHIRFMSSWGNGRFVARLCYLISLTQILLRKMLRGGGAVAPGPQWASRRRCRLHCGSTTNKKLAATHLIENPQWMNGHLVSERTGCDCTPALMRRASQARTKWGLAVREITPPL